MYYKLGQASVINWGSFVLLQIRANVVTNWGSFIITNQGKCCYKLRQLLQIRATVITKQGSYYKLEQNVLQIGAGITNQGNFHKLLHNNIKTTRSTRKKSPCFDICVKAKEGLTSDFWVNISESPNYLKNYIRISQMV